VVIQLLTQLDKIVLWLVTIVVVPSIVFTIATTEPMLERCTGRVVDALERAEPNDRKPPAALVKAIRDEDLRRVLAVAAFSGSRPAKLDFGFSAARWAFVERCDGPPRMDLGWRLNMIPVGWWMNLRFSEDDLIALYVSRSYLGRNVYGFASAARVYYGREVTALTADELRCLVRRQRAPSRRQWCAVA